MRLARELGGPHIGNPNLDGPQALGAKPAAVLTHAVPAARLLMRTHLRALGRIRTSATASGGRCSIP